MEHVAPATSVVPDHEFAVMVKSRGAAPPGVSAPIARSGFPVLVTVIVGAAEFVLRAWLPKLIEVGVNETAFTGVAVAVPLSETVGLPVLSVIVSVAVRLPAAAGLNVTLIEQDAPGTTVAGHELVAVKSVA